MVLLPCPVGIWEPRCQNKGHINIIVDQALRLYSKSVASLWEIVLNIVVSHFRESPIRRPLKRLFLGAIQEVTPAAFATALHRGFLIEATECRIRMARVKKHL